mmetsp:Transcript_45023/g.146252  ORF Transcript_45023/g.146252 Transcript_45023/m.146252 type:complete len:241 (+) Transcript_45023:1095-1817(+)
MSRSPSGCSATRPHQPSTRASPQSRRPSPTPARPPTPRRRSTAPSAARSRSRRCCAWLASTRFLRAGSRKRGWPHCTRRCCPSTATPPPRSPSTRCTRLACCGGTTRGRAGRRCARRSIWSPTTCPRWRACPTCPPPSRTTTQATAPSRPGWSGGCSPARRTGRRALRRSAGCRDRSSGRSHPRGRARSPPLRCPRGRWRGARLRWSTFWAAAPTRRCRPCAGSASSCGRRSISWLRART